MQLHLAYLGYLPCYLSPQPTYLLYLGLGIISDGMEVVGCELLQHLERFGIYLGFKIFNFFETFISILKNFISCLEISIFWGENMLFIEISILLLELFFKIWKQKFEKINFEILLIYENFHFNCGNFHFISETFIFIDL